MTSGGRKYFSGESIEQALLQAARHHGLEPREIAYRKIEKRHGFLKTRRGVIIEVDPAAPRKTISETAEVSPDAGSEQTASVGEVIAEEPKAMDDIQNESAENLPDVSREAPEVEEATGELADAARRGIEELLEFTGLDLQSKVRLGDEQFEIELWGPDQDRLVEDRGDLLLAIQHLLPRMIRGYAGRSFACRVDSGNFHATRRAELERLAIEAAQQVRQRHQPRSLPPMNPAERRIVHMTLADEGDVVTESQGKGFYKRVTVRLAMRRPRGFDRYSR